MGNFFSRKVEAKDELEQLREKEKVIDKMVFSLQEQQRTVSNYLFLFFLVAIVAVVAECLINRPEIRAGIVLGAAGSVTVIGFIAIRRIVVKIYNFRTQRQLRIKDQLLSRRNTILEEVKENKNFNEAKEIIMRFGTAEDIRAVNGVNRASPPKTTPAVNTNAKPKLNGSVVAPETPAASAPSDTLATPFQTPAAVKGPELRKRPPMMPAHLLSESFHTPRSVVRPLPVTTRTPMDKLIDFVIGDGPNNKYALICQKCYTHNGMALPHELPKIAYRCFKCDFFNPPKIGLPPSAHLTPNVSRRPSMEPATRSSSVGDISTKEEKTATDVPDNATTSASSVSVQSSEHEIAQQHNSES